jgi:hypothetical protein
MQTDITSLTNQLADLLSAAGEAWSTDTHRHHADQRVLRGPAGEEIVIAPAHEPRRLSISGSFWLDGADLYPHRSRGESPCAITVSADRPASAIAAEIRRRLLPAYRASLEAARRRKAEHDAQQAYVTTTAAALAALVGEVPYRDQPGKFSTGYGRRYGARVEVYTTGDVRMELSRLTADQARQILTILHAAEE